MGSRSTDHSSGALGRRIAGSFVVGLVVIGVVLTAALAASRPLFAAVLPPAAGGAVAGYLVRGRRRLGAALGALLGSTVAIGSIVLFVSWLESRPPMTGGAGLGIAALFLVVVVVGVLAILFGGLGGLLGAALRRELAQSTRSRPVDERDESDGPGRHGDRYSAAAPADDPRAVADRSTAARRGLDSDERVAGADAEPVDDRGPIANVLIGSALSTVIFFVPGSPFVGGVATGHLERDGWRRGALLGAVSGLVAAPLILAVIVLIAVAVFFVFAGAFVDFLPWLAALLGAYSVVLSAVGGAVGGVLSTAATAD